MAHHRAEPARRGAAVNRLFIACIVLAVMAAVSLVATAVAPSVGAPGAPDPETTPTATVAPVERTVYSSTIRTDAEALDGAPEAGRTVLRTVAEALVHSGGDGSAPVIGSVAADLQVATYDRDQDQTKIWFRDDYAWTATENLHTSDTAPSASPSSTPSPSAPAEPTAASSSSTPSASAGSSESSAPTGSPPSDPGAASDASAEPAAPAASSPSPSPSPASSPSATTAPEGVPEAFTVHGSGWGHGVGMSQYGAVAMARNGHGHAQILAHYYPGTTLASRSLDRSIRVHLLATPQITLKGSGSLRLAGQGGHGTQVHLKADGDRVTARLDGDGGPVTSGRMAVEWTGTTHWAGQAATVSVPRADNGTRTVALRHGRVEVTARDGKLQVVNVLNLDDEYLYGLAEVPSTWPREALAAQAIAGRTYALKNLDRVDPSCDCHVTDETSSQKFTGYNHESGPSAAAWVAAVDATAGRVLTHGGRPIEASYHSSSGGHTRSAQDVWGRAVPYLVGRPDPWTVHASAANPHASWSRGLSQSEARELFGSASPVVSVDVVKAGDGTIESAVARSADGSRHSVSGDDFRSAVDARSRWITSVTTR